MAKSSKKKTTTARRSYAPKKKKTRRKSTLNRSTVGPMKSAGALIGAGITYGPSVMASIKGRSLNPIVGAVTDKDVAISGIKRVAVGYIAGGIAGKIVDSVGLKRPVNRMIRTVKRLV